MSGTRSPAPKAPATEAGAPATALLLCGHGARGTAGVVRRHAEVLRGRGGFAAVAGGCLFGEPSLEEALADLSAPRVVLVPVLMAEGYTLRVMERRLAAADTAHRARLARPLGTHPDIARIAAGLGERAGHAQGWTPRRAALLLVGHGTLRDPASGDTVRRHASALGRTGRFAAVRTAFLDEPPSIAEALAGLPPMPAAAVGMFTDAGMHGEQDVPRLLAECPRETAYAGPLGPEPEVADLILALAAATGPEVAAVAG